MMLRTRLCAIGAVVGVFGLGLAAYSFQDSDGPADAFIQAGKKIEPNELLPISQVILFNSGVGYMQREGEVDGNARVQLSFAASDINDLLKSLVLQDAKGQVGVVHYDSSDPIEKTLRSFALDLTSNPTFGQILNQARGEKVELTRSEKKDALTSKISGVIVGLETQLKSVAKDLFLEAEILNLSTPTGLQSIPMDQVVSVRFSNPTLEAELQRALSILASAHDTQKKTVSVGFNGQGKRQVRVGYVLERPIWKTTYRLRLDPKGKIFLQGWALVENTSDDDWNDVRMVLVSGKPISFKMNLYDPIYIPRPFVEPEMYASLRPPVYGGAMTTQNAGMFGMVGMGGLMGMGMIGAGPPPDPTEGRPMPNGMMGMPMGGMGMGGMGMGGMGGQLMGASGGQFSGGSFQGGFGGGQMVGGQMMGGQGLNRFQQQSQQALERREMERAFQEKNKLTYDELQRRRVQKGEAADEAQKKGPAVAGFNFQEGIQSVASADEVGDYFHYTLDQKISLPRQKSAMLPIVDQTIEGQKVSIFNDAVHAKYPLLGLKIKNTSGQPLTQGPITVYDGGVFGGDTRILDLQPNEVRLLSYALDQGTEVKIDTKEVPGPDLHFRLGDDYKLSARYILRKTRTYTIKNRSTHDRLVILEQPIRSEWKLTDPKQATEQTRDLYRFQVAVPAGKVVVYDVVEEQPRIDEFSGRRTYDVANGISVKIEANIDFSRLIDLKIVKGMVQPTLRTREIKAYFIQNLTDIDRTLTIDYVVRPGWTRVDDEKTPQAGPAVFRFKLDVAKGKTGQQTIREERVAPEAGTPLKLLGESTIRDYVGRAASSAAVKAALMKSLDMQIKIADTLREIAALDQQLNIVTGDHARVRENLKIVPMTSEHYKTFLEKFVNQDKQIETLQTTLRELNAALLRRQRDYDQFVTKLDVE
jgi:hypothetical protein